METVYGGVSVKRKKRSKEFTPEPASKKKKEDIPAVKMKQNALQAKKKLEDVTEVKNMKKEDTAVKWKKEDTAVKWKKEDTAVKWEKEDTAVKWKKEDTAVKLEKEDTVVKWEKEDTAMKWKKEDIIIAKLKKEDVASVKKKKKDFTAFKEIKQTDTSNKQQKKKTKAGTANKKKRKDISPAKRKSEDITREREKMKGIAAVASKMKKINATRKNMGGSTEPEFSHVRFKFLLRSPGTVLTGLQTFLDLSCQTNDEEAEEMDRLLLLESYLKSSPRCSEVLSLLTSKLTPETNLVFAWLRLALQECPKVIRDFQELQNHIVKTILTQHTHLLMNSLHKGNKPSQIKSTLLLLVTIASLGYKFVKLLQVHLDFSHGNWQDLLSRRDRKDEVDVRTCMTALLMKLLQADDEDLTRSLVEQRVLLQEVLVGLKYDKSEHVATTLETIHRCIILNKKIGKSSKIYLFSTPVLKELLILYQWLGPAKWPGPKRRQMALTEEEKLEYSAEQQAVAVLLHPMMVDLLSNHKLGICFRDRTFGLSNENKNSTVGKVLQLLVTSYRAPLSHQLVMAILRACPDQLQNFLKLLHPHLVPKPVDTWLVCVQFFLKIMENHDWPDAFTEDSGSLLSEKASQLVHYLFPPDSIVHSLKEGLKNACATVRYFCLKALEVIAVRGQQFCNISKSKLGDKSPVTLGIEGMIRKILPNGQVLLNLLQKCSSQGGFDSALTRNLYKDSEIPLPQVTPIQHLVAILGIFSLVPEYLTDGMGDSLPLLLQLVAEASSSEEKLGVPSERMPRNLPALYLLHALSECDIRKLNLFGKGGKKGDLKQSLMYNLIHLMQSQPADESYTQTAQVLIVKLLSSTGLFDDHKRELQIWLHHLKRPETAPEEVIMYFVGLLYQYIPNPYPAIDRLWEQVEKAAEPVNGPSQPLDRLEFSPLVMFALSGDFYNNKKVHNYLCRVLIDIFHSLHDVRSFSRLVHALSSHLNQVVTRYLTFDDKDEKVTTKSDMMPLHKRVRLKQMKSSIHFNVSLMKEMMKGEEILQTAVKDMAAEDCLLLVQQSLCYLNELLSGTVIETNWKLGKLCVEALRATSMHLACCSDTNCTTTLTKNMAAHLSAHSTTGDRVVVDSTVKRNRGTKNLSTASKKQASSCDSSVDDINNNDIANENSSTEDGTICEARPGTAHSDKEVVFSNKYLPPLCLSLSPGESGRTSLSQLSMDWYKEMFVYILNHPLISQWLFVEGFKQKSAFACWIVCQLCEIIQTLSQQRDSVFSMESVFSVTGKIQQLAQAALEAGSDAKDRLTGSAETLFCQCLNTLLAVGKKSCYMKALLSLVNLPMEYFICESTHQPSVLAQIVFKIAHNISPDPQSIKELHSCQNYATSLRKFFRLVSALKSSELESLALTCVKVDPTPLSACSQEAFLDLLNKLSTSASPSLQPLVECLMMHNSECLSLCGQWLQKKKSTIKKRKLELAPIMLIYLQQFLKIKDNASDDGLHTIAGAVCFRLDMQPLDTGNVTPTFLLVLCHLINFSMIDSSTAQKLKDKILTLIRKEACLFKAHIQLLAAVLRLECLQFCDLDLDQETNDLDKNWRDFKETTGLVLVDCLRYLNKQMTAEGDDSEQKAACKCLVHLCEDLISLTLQQNMKTTILSFWPEFMTGCLKYHFKDAVYVSLLRHVVLRVFTEEIQTDSEKPLEDNIGDDGTGEDNSKFAYDSSSAEEDSVDESAGNFSVTHTKLKSRAEAASEKMSFSPHCKDFDATVLRTARRLGLKKRSDVAQKCVVLFGDDVDREDFPSVHAEVISSWLGSGAKSFFPWPKVECSMSMSGMKTSLISPSHGAVLVDMCEKCVGHTAFLSVLQGGEHQAVRSELLSLLACLVRLEKTCCSTLPVGVLLAAYGATLSSADQNLLYLMLACDRYGEVGLKPGLWGEKAMEQLEMEKSLGKSLLYETSPQDVIGLVDDKTMTASILHFPLLRTMNFQHMDCAERADRMMSLDGCYDPRFLLQIFYHFTGPEHVVDVRLFITKKCLGYTLVALSSHDMFTRQLAIGILVNLYSHIESLHHWSSSKPVLLAFLKVIMNGMTKKCQKIPSVITIFLVKAAEIFVIPGDDMYIPVYSFLMLKSALDVGNVPELYRFFNSPKLKERLWILQILQEGLRETSDHGLFQKRYVYKLLMCHANSSLSDYQTKRESLKVLVKASSIATVARDQVTKHGLLPWLVSFIKDSLPDRAESVHLVCQLLHNLCYTLEFNSRRLWWLSLARMTRNCLLHTPLLVCVQLVLTSFSHLDIQSLSLLLDILQHPYLTPSSPITLLPLAVTILWHLGHLANDTEMTGIAANLAGDVGLVIPTASGTDRVEDKNDVNIQQRVVQLGKRASDLLSHLDLNGQPLWMVGNGTKSVQVIVEKLQAFFLQYV